MQKLSDIATPEFEVPSYCTELGGYNDFPQPCVPVDEDEFNRTFFHRSATHLEFRQIAMAGDNCPGDANIFWFQECALIMRAKYDGKSNTTTIQRFKVG